MMEKNREDPLNKGRKQHSTDERIRDEMNIVNSADQK